MTGTVGIDPAQNTVRVSSLPAPPSTPVPYQTRLDVADTGDALFHCVALPQPQAGR